MTATRLDQGATFLYSKTLHYEPDTKQFENASFKMLTTEINT